VVRQDDVSAVTYEQIAVNLHARFPQRSDFLQKRDWVENYAVADHAATAGAQYAARHELENEPFTVDDDCVTGVVASGVARDYRKSL